MAIKTFTAGSVLTASDTNTFLANAGLVFITEKALTGATTQIDNCFSATYDAYRIVFSGLTFSTVDDMAMRFTTSGTPNQSGSYYSCRAAGATSFVLTNTTAATFAYNGLVGNTTAGGGTIEIQNPFSNTQRTSFQSSGVDTRTTGSPIRMGTGFFDGNTRFDGFWVASFNGTYTMGGVMRVYGYRQA